MTDFEKIPELLRNIEERLKRLETNTPLLPPKVTPRQKQLLALIREQNGKYLPQWRLGELLGVSQSNICVLIRRLRKNGVLKN